MAYYLESSSMNYFLSMVLFVLCLSGSLFAQTQNPSVAKLSKELAEKAPLLNPEYLLFSPRSLPKHKIPLLIYLHGGGGVGSDIQRLRGQASQVWRGIDKYRKGPCYVVAPQAQKSSRQKGGWVPKDLNVLLEQLKSTLKVDENRIYLTGNSMGGYGSWIWGGHNPELFAAIAPVSGGIGPGGPKDVTPHLDKWATNLAKVPVMAFVGAKDRVVPAERSQRMVAAIKKAGGQKVNIRIYPDEGHGAGRIAFGSKEFYEWMFSHKKEES